MVKGLNIYHIEQIVEDPGAGKYGAGSRMNYFRSAIVVAETAAKAEKIHPSGDNANWGKVPHTWAKDPKGVEAVCVGVAAKCFEEGTILCSNFFTKPTEED